MRIMLKKSVVDEICRYWGFPLVKAVKTRRQEFLEIKRELLAHIRKLRKQEEADLKKASWELEKSFALEKATGKKREKAENGAIRTWSNGKKYKRIAPGKWVQVFNDDRTRGAKQSLRYIERKIASINDERELMWFVQQNKEKFVDNWGYPLPAVERLSELAHKRNDEIVAGKKAAEQMDTQAQTPEKAAEQVEQIRQGFSDKIASTIDEKPIQEVLNLCVSTGKGAKTRLQQVFNDILKNQIAPSFYNKIQNSWTEDAIKKAGKEGILKNAKKHNAELAEAALKGEVDNKGKDEVTVFFSKTRQDALNEVEKYQKDRDYLFDRCRKATRTMFYTVQEYRNKIEHDYPDIGEDVKNRLANIAKKLAQRCSSSSFDNQELHKMLIHDRPDLVLDVKSYFSQKELDAARERAKAIIAESKEELAMRIMLKKSVVDEICRYWGFPLVLKSVRDPKFEYFKRKILEHLDELERQEAQETKKSIAYLERLEKAQRRTYNVGEIATWKNGKYIKGADKKWRRYYEGHSKQVESTITRLKGKVRKCQNSSELWDLVANNWGRFMDADKMPLPIVREFHQYVSTIEDEINAGVAVENRTAHKAKRVAKKRASGNNKSGGKTDENHRNNIKRGRISKRDTSIRNDSGGRGVEYGIQDGDKKPDRDGVKLNSDKPRGRHGTRQTKLKKGRGVIGLRQTKAESRALRERIKDLLNSKADDEFTEEDKNLLRLYEGAGGLGEKDASSAGVLNEFYTPYSVVKKVWDIVDKYNPDKNKRVIEPSAGTGRFAEGRNEHFTMFEIDETSARINHILHPSADIQKKYFQENFINGGIFTSKFEKYDVAIGNPPYGKYSGFYKGRGEGKEHSRYEEYFIDRSLDTLKDGGILAMVVPSSFLRGKNSKIKEALEKKGKLLEAWRLPNGTFNSTGVGTDIIVIRKEKGDAGSFSDDAYFKVHPECVIGTETERTGRFGKKEKYVALDSGQSFDEAIEKIDANLIKANPLAKTKTKIEKKKKPSSVKRTKKEDVKETEEEKHRNRSEAMKGNQNAKKDGLPEEELKNPYTMTAEQFNEKYGKAIPAEEIELWKHTRTDGIVDITALDDNLKKYVETSGRYVQDNGQWVHVVNFASGNIVEKLEALAPSDSEYELKKKILKQALPTQKKLEQIEASVLDNWMRDRIVSDTDGNKRPLVEAFLYWVGGEKFINQSWGWDSDTSPVARSELPNGISMTDVWAYINRIPDRSKSKNETVAEQQKRQNARHECAERLFNRFLQEGLNKIDKDKLCKDWNKQFNSQVNPDYLQIPIIVDGMNTHKGSKEFTLLQQQLKGASFLANKGRGLLAYDVGVGKTVTGIVATVNQIQTGRAKKPLICVPKSVYKNWINSIHEHFPNQKVVELENMSKFNGSEIPDGAISVCTYEALDKITFKQDAIDELIEDVEAATVVADDARGAAQGHEDSGGIVGEGTKTKNKSFFFEDLGFDHITIDEVHNFKNVFTVPRNYSNKNKKEANEFSAVGGGKPAQRARRMFLITQYLQRHNNDRNVFALSATPFTNSPVEIYSMLSLIARSRLKELDIYSLKSFMEKFINVTNEYVVKGNQKVEPGMVVKDFKQLSALQNLLTEFIDKVDGEEAGVKRPKKVVHTPELQLTDVQKQYIEEQIENMSNSKEKGAALVAMTNMRSVVLSPALVIPELANKFVESSPKMKFVCDSILQQYKAKPKNGQVIYLPRGVGGKDDVDGFKQVKEYLIKHGMPADSIEFIRNGVNLDKREKIKNDFNNPDGKCKVLIGSSAIQEGMDLNGNSTTLYNCMLGWNPSEIAQVEGRIWRQGNKQNITHIVYPLMEDSIDALMFQKYDEKRSRINDLWSYKGDKLNVEDIDANEMKFNLIKDPEKRADIWVGQKKERLLNEQRSYDVESENLEKLRVGFSTVEEVLGNTYDYSYIDALSTLKYENNPPYWLSSEQIKKAKAKVAAFKRSAAKRIENAKKELQARGLKTAADIDQEQKKCNEKKEKIDMEISNLETQKKVFIEKTKKELAQQRKVLPSLKEATKQLSESILSQLDERIDDEDDIRLGIKKSFAIAYFKAHPRRCRLIVRKSVARQILRQE